MSVRNVRLLAEYVGLSLIWGLSFLFMLRVVAVFGLVGAVCFRALIAASLLLGVAALTGRKLNFAVPWYRFAIVGAMTVACQLLGLCYALPLIGTAMAAILVAAIPLFAMMIGHWWGLESMTVARVVGLVLGTVGIVLLVGFPSHPITREFLLGCASAVFGAFCSAIGSNYASARLRTVAPLETTLGAFLSGGVLTLPLLLVSPVRSDPGVMDWINLLVLGVLMSALAYVMYFRLVASIGATRAVSVEFIVTLVAVIVGTAILHEHLTVVQCIGALTVLTGCALVLGILPGGRSQAHGSVPVRTRSD
jgi:drug/metabolite transporter (DMT)-like permease